MADKRVPLNPIEGSIICLLLILVFVAVFTLPVPQHWEVISTFQKNVSIEESYFEAKHEEERGSVYSRHTEVVPDRYRVKLILDIDGKKYRFTNDSKQIYDLLKGRTNNVPAIIAKRRITTKNAIGLGEDYDYLIVKLL